MEIEPQLLGELRRASAMVAGSVSDTGLIAVDTAMRIILMEGEVFAPHGFSSEEVIGQPVGAVLADRSAEQVLDSWKAALAGEKRSVDRHADDPASNYSIAFGPLSSDSGEVIGAIAVVRDVTERARVAAELEVSLGHQQALARLGATFMKGADAGTLADLACADLGRLLETEMVAILSISDDRRDLHPVSGWAGSAERDRPLLEFVVALDEPLMTTDLGTDQRFATTQLAELGIGSCLVLPLPGVTRSHGLLVIYSTATDGFSAPQVALAEAVSAIVGSSMERAVREAAEERLWALSIDLLATASAEGYLTRLSPSWEQALGYTRDELMAVPYVEFVHPDDIERTLDEARALLDPEHHAVSFENRYRTKDGSYRWLSWNSRRSPDGQSIHCIVRDTTDAREAHDALRASEERLLVAQRIAGVGSWELEVGAGSFTVSEGLVEIFGLTRSMVEPEGDLRSFLGRVHAEDRDQVRATIIAVSNGQQPSDIDYRYVRGDGAEIWIHGRAELVRRDGAVMLVRGTVQDITQRKLGERRLHEAQELFHQGFYNAPIGMGVIDPGRGAFLFVNDAMCSITGHSRNELEASGALARFGDPRDAAEDHDVFEQMMRGELSVHESERRCLRDDVVDCWLSRVLSPVTGVDGRVTAILCQVTDISERRAREESLVRQVEEAGWLARIREALDHDRFVLHAQPIADIATGLIVKHELLLRMLDQHDDLVPPGAFLPTAEKFGLITEIDHWVVTRGIDLAASGMPVTINLSGPSIGHPAMLLHIEDQLARSGAAAGDVTFEITETALMDDLGRGEQFARRLVALGCHFALDDFGTGYGSFTYLKKLPADYLKIDMEFVRQLPENPADLHVVTAIVALAQGFGQQTIAEGVEDEATLDLLRQVGVDFAQGYHIGRPAPIKQGAPA